ncbi:MAG: alpha/beta hydrolase [Actinomycetota bacterium]|nr:alpha/beta hydrolase [Actinomycetota bacterium]
MPFELDAGGAQLSGEEIGAGPAIALLHGITATRRYVVHDSKALPRRGYRLLSYDARAHGESGAAPPGEGYSYAELAADLGQVLDARAAESPLLCGHSMGCHTVAAYALEHASELAGVVLLGPATLGLPSEDESIARWDRLADGLEQGGAEGFMRAYEQVLEVEPDWRETVLRITRERMLRHRHPEALAEAIRQVPRSAPFDGLAELESLDLPALVVASRDEADPGHRRAVAEAWAAALPKARLIAEQSGEAPLAWRGGQLSRAIAEFAGEPEVSARLGRPG